MWVQGNRNASAESIPPATLSLRSINFITNTNTVTHLLSIIRTVKVISGDAALGAGHVPSNDEVGTAEVLADHHVLNGLNNMRSANRAFTYSTVQYSRPWSGKKCEAT